RATGAGGPPLVLKIAPDLDDEDLAEIAEVALSGAIDGLIIANTTIARPAGLRSRRKSEAGGLSGRPLLALSTEILGKMYRLTKGEVPLIGVGGISSAADALAKIRAGASLVALYSALIYQGPGLVSRIKAELPELLRAQGFSRLGDAVGADHRG
ncbi:MAG: dihydroorotate dehydrogenase (quinone), partial [Proteobacteria bacterium]|nr:dihydroorotate dehydrogenase (quinone) [Pseudomonadota bacterium]